MKKRACSIKGCAGRILARGFCARHYQALQRDRTLGDVTLPSSPCRVVGCDRSVSARRLCAPHYLRVRKHGKTGPAKIRVANRSRGFARYIDRQGYVVLERVRGKKIREHREVMERKLGRPLLPGETVHHKNGIRSDNRRGNLELWASFQPYGQRVKDLVTLAREILHRYA